MLCQVGTRLPGGVGCLVSLMSCGRPSTLSASITCQLKSERATEFAMMRRLLPSWMLLGRSARRVAVSTP
jgi:hypothetical protein